MPLDSGQALHTLTGHQDWGHAVAVTGDGRAITTSSDHTAIVWDLDSGQALHTLTGHQGPVIAVAVIGDGRAITTSSDGTAVVWELARGQKVASWYADYAVTVVGWSERESAVVAGDAGGGVDVLRLKI